MSFILPFHVKIFITINTKLLHERPPLHKRMHAILPVIGKFQFDLLWVVSDLSLSAVPDTWKTFSLQRRDSLIIMLRTQKTFVTRSCKIENDEPGIKGLGCYVGALFRGNPLNCALIRKRLCERRVKKQHIKALEAVQRCAIRFICSDYSHWFSSGFPA